jgi:hypothetical protein
LHAVTRSDRFAAWLITGPPGHFWSALADIVVLWTRYLVARARGRPFRAG